MWTPLRLSRLSHKQVHSLFPDAGRISRSGGHKGMKLGKVYYLFGIFLTAFIIEDRMVNECTYKQLSVTIAQFKGVAGVQCLEGREPKEEKKYFILFSL